MIYNKFSLYGQIQTQAHDLFTLALKRHKKRQATDVDLALNQLII